MFEMKKNSSIIIISSTIAMYFLEGHPKLQLSQIRQEAEMGETREVEVYFR